MPQRSTIQDIGQRFAAWARVVFGDSCVNNTRERGLRILEEACELAQALGVDRAFAERVVARVYSRRPGSVPEEIAGVAGTLLVCADVYRVDLVDLVEAELARISALDSEVVRAKHREKAEDGIAMSLTTCRRGTTG